MRACGNSGWSIGAAVQQHTALLSLLAHPLDQAQRLRRLHRWPGSSRRWRGSCGQRGDGIGQLAGHRRRAAPVTSGVSTLWRQIGRSAGWCTSAPRTGTSSSPATGSAASRSSALASTTVLREVSVKAMAGWALASTQSAEPQSCETTDSAIGMLISTLPSGSRHRVHAQRHQVDRALLSASRSRNTCTVIAIGSTLAEVLKRLKPCPHYYASNT